MDTLSHGLWGGVIAKVANRTSPRLSYGWSFWWGVFPDLAAFGIPFLWLFSRIAFSSMTFADIYRSHGSAPPSLPASYWFDTFAPTVYNYSHSFIIFIGVFALVALIARRPVWELMAWPLHILVDIPTHTDGFYVTPFLWPVSDVHVQGIRWLNMELLLVNYALLALVYLALKSRKRSSAIPFQQPPTS